MPCSPCRAGRPSFLLAVLLSLLILPAPRAAAVEVEDLLQSARLSDAAALQLRQAASRAEAAGVPASQIRAVLERALAREVPAAYIEQYLGAAARAAQAGVPVTPVTNKVLEGLAKGADPQGIAQTTMSLAASLQRARGVVDEAQRHGLRSRRVTARLGAMQHMATALQRGATEAQLRELVAAGQQGKQTIEELGAAAEALGELLDRRFPASGSVRLMGTALEHRYRRGDLARLSRALAETARDGMPTPDELLAVATQEIGRGRRSQEVVRALRRMRLERAGR